MDVATLAGLLREAADHHHHYEQTTPAHDWSEWYAPYISAREQGSAPRMTFPRTTGASRLSLSA